ncbi:hypothetical protein BI364_12505 [Acidihalobacter yilgarnensis]|uniref:Uncharacterized protein n=1 Tax=Acidihalobacter yilgarnensis TaxID=2819280 RepID=A0A1D8IQG7_9GAMM|nr:hypothetical protein [Acidihalobacter yilgarnensis]AOU98673.1 hypothetical protein BI364_12505 [Acidihalobacter yilgarnensis]
MAAKIIFQAPPPRASAHEIALSAANVINPINQRLEELRLRLRETQPVKVGSVTLGLYACGRGCLTCPHLKWSI